jgi:pimeloyl-ACP methyl ester carboxylesterase
MSLELAAGRPADGTTRAIGEAEGGPRNLKLYICEKSKPPLLAIRGKHDPFFMAPGAEAHRRDSPNATVQFLDTGHFALETHLEEFASAMRQLLSKTAG